MILISQPRPQAANILLVINTVVDPQTTANINDQEVVDQLISQGHVVTLADDNTVSLADTAAQDLVIISSSSSSTAPGVNALSASELRIGRLPVICYEPALYDELLLQTAETYGNAGGHTTLAIAAGLNHPLAAGKSGEVEIVEPGWTATVSSSSLPLSVGADAIVMATNATAGHGDLGRAAIWAYEKGSTLADDSTVTGGRKVAFFYNASTDFGVYNQNARDLLMAAVNWALAEPASGPIIALWRSPEAVNASPGAALRVELENSPTSQVATNTISLLLNDQEVAPSITQSGGITTISFVPESVLPAGSANTVAVVYSDRGTPPGTFTNSFEFVVADYATLSRTFAYPPGSGDTSAPGFRARVVQANTFSGTLPNSEARAEAQLAGTLIDPFTEQPYDNEANLTDAGADGYFTDPNVINWNQDALGFGDEQGNFRDPEHPDEPIPGIPGVDGFNTDNIAAEILTYLELEAGAHTFGVNSDDGFVVAAGVDGRDVLRVPLGRFDGGRGSADTLFNFVAEESGVYPFRLLWYEGNGGANLEFFSVDPASGDKILINDPDDARAINAWRQLTVPLRPFVRFASPLPGTRGVPVDADLEFTLQNTGTSVSTNSVRLNLNGEALPLTSLSVSGNDVNVVAAPSGSLASSTDYTVQLIYSDDASPAFTVTNEFTFRTMRAPISLPPLRQDDSGLVVIEAENFNANTPAGEHRWEFDQTPAGYSGDGTMYALPDDPGAVVNYPDSLTMAPRLDYQVEFAKTGTHYFWYRASDGGGDSINAGVDGDSPNDTMNNIDEGCCGDRLVPGGVSFTWVRGIDGTPEGRSQFEISQAGTHTINVWMREDGLIIDKIVITTDPNFTPIGAGPEESSRTGDPFPPVVTLTSPAEGAIFAAGASIAINADATDQDGTVSKVEFFANGVKIGEDASAPFSIQFTPSAERPYTLTATAVDDTGLTAESGGVKIVSGNPPAVLFLGNNPLTQSGDLVIISQLEDQGYVVTPLDDDESQTSDADGKVLVVISSTVSSGAVNVKFTDVAVPVINWEEALFDDLNMTGDSGSSPDHHGTTGSQTQVEIINPSHPLAAGLSGMQTVTSSPETMSWGYLETTPTDAIVIATVAGNPLQWAIWAYDKGGVLYNGLPAPEKRIGFFFNGGSTTANTPEAARLFTAAVNWARGIVDEPAPELAISRQSGNQVSISWAGGGTLESTASLGDPESWTPVANAENPHIIPATDPHRFFRVRK